MFNIEKVLRLPNKAKLEVSGVEVDFIQSYKYPYFAHRYMGYVLKVCTSISEKEVKESRTIIKQGYLPIYIVKLGKSKKVNKLLEKENRHLGFDPVLLEIKKSILDVKNFKGVILLDISKEDSYIELATCLYSKEEGDYLIVEGFKGSLNCIIDKVLLIYNSKISRIGQL